MTKKSSSMGNSSILRTQLIDRFDDSGAHASFAQIVAGWPASLRGIKPEAAAHTPWQVLEHLRIAQWDILEFSRNPKHVSPDFPGGYWPQTSAPPGASAWENSIRGFNDDLDQMKELLRDPSSDLFQPIPHGTGQTLLREAMVLAAHNSYHLGELMLLRRLLGVPPAPA